MNIKRPDICEELNGDEEVIMTDMTMMAQFQNPVISKILLDADLR